MKKFFKFYLKRGKILFYVGLFVVIASNAIGGIKLTFTGIAMSALGVYPYLKK